MAEDLEEQKKTILPFLQRAQEIQAADLKVAYYCRLYAVEQALKFEKRAKEINGLLTATLAQLEKDKLKVNPDKDNDKVQCEAFALRIFANADRVDRLGKADVNTSKAYYAASCFLEILNQFGPVDKDLLDKQRYAAWRAAEIRKAVREGRPPMPPPEGQQAPSYLDDPSAIAGAAAGPSGSGPGMPDQGMAGPSSAGPPAGWDPAQMRTSSGSGLGGAGPVAGGPGPQAVLPGQRYKPGSPVLFYDGSHAHQGTVGQLIPQPGGGFRYRVALAERLVEGGDAEVAPNPPEGRQVSFMRQPGLWVPAETVLVNDMGWPPSYLVRTKDGIELSAQAHQVSLITPEDMGLAPQAPLPPPQQPPATYPSFGAGPVMPPPPSQPSNSSFPTIPSQSFQPPGHPQFTAPPPARPQPPPPAQPQPRPAAQPGPPSFPPAAPAHSYTPPASFPQAAPVPGFKPPVLAIAEAQKNAKYAISSLNFEDVATAVKHLQTALKLLTQPQ